MTPCNNPGYDLPSFLRAGTSHKPSQTDSNKFEFNLNPSKLI
jgi:hypothetical protein